MKKNTKIQIETKHSSRMITTQDRKLYDIPVEGSLGLLALGASGLIQWRKKRDSQLQQSSNYETQ
jgi:hypothetical protein